MKKFRLRYAGCLRRNPPSRSHVWDEVIVTIFQEEALGSGHPLIRMAMFLMKSFRADATLRPPGVDEGPAKATAHGDRCNNSAAFSLTCFGILR
ncbi:hypothetical protein FHX09_004172 [Rhizobium sp. BK538]|nr:hypothetical protein [Rhizobium sp. BK538]